MCSVDWTAVGAVIQALATVVLVLVTWKYASTTRKIAKASKEQAEAANSQAKAATDMTSSSVRPVLVVTNRRIGWNTNRNEAIVEFVIANVGNGPALNPTVRVMKRTDDGDYQRVRGWKGTFPPIAAGAQMPDVQGMGSVKFKPREGDEGRWQEFAHRRSEGEYGLDVDCLDMYGDRWRVQYRPMTEQEWRMSRLNPPKPMPTDAEVDVGPAAEQERAQGVDPEDSDD